LRAVDVVDFGAALGLARGPQKSGVGQIQIFEAGHLRPILRDHDHQGVAVFFALFVAFVRILQLVRLFVLDRVLAVFAGGALVPDKVDGGETAGVVGAVDQAGVVIVVVLGRDQQQRRAEEAPQQHGALMLGVPSVLLAFRGWGSSLCSLTMY